MYKKSLFIFRRDLRLSDNTALNKVLELSEIVIPCFIFDPRQITEKNDYYNPHAVQFMIESLIDLNKQLNKRNGKLYLFYGIPEDVIKNLISSIPIEAVFFNKDYTPFSIKRDLLIEKLCQKHAIAYCSFDDAVLQPPHSVTKKDGSAYSVFTAFYNNAHKLPVKQPYTIKQSNFFKHHISSEKISTIFEDILKHNNTTLFTHGGRQKGLITLQKISSLEQYKHNHNIPRYATSGLSAHLKFGTLSVREVYWKIAHTLGNNHLLIKQLYWRDFFTYIAFHYPGVFGNPFRQKYARVTWNNDKKAFKLWCTGMTGFPIVDAGMRQLNATGFMHNRVRMIVASFLTKDLHINWLWGEKYFAQKLVDYDPALNNGNWQWCASTGCDTQPYFRIFNPWLQQKKYDPDCAYIKKWVPELKNEKPHVIHTLFKKNSPTIKHYPKPILNHTQESLLAKQYYKKVY